MRKESKIKRNDWSSRPHVRYALMQVPGWLFLGLILMILDQWLDLPGWLLWVSAALWIGKDIAMFPFVRTAYEQLPEESAYGLIGESAVARDRLNPSGHVQVRGEIWKAELVSGVPAVEKDQRVVVRNVRGLTLLVQPENQGG